MFKIYSGAKLNALVILAALWIEANGARLH